MIAYATSVRVYKEPKPLTNRGLWHNGRKGLKEPTTTNPYIYCQL